MYKLISIIVAALALFAPAAGKPQVVVDPYPYYAAAPAYVASGYSTPLAYSYPYAYAYSYPLAYY